MKLSLKIVLMKAISDCVDFRNRIKADYDRLSADAPEELKILTAEMALREDALDKAWAASCSEMNPAERKRYVEMISYDPDAKAGRPTPMQQAEAQYPQHVLESLTRVRKVFPGAKILGIEKPGQTIALEADHGKYAPVKASPRPERREAEIVPVRRAEPALPPMEAVEAQTELF